MGMAAGQARLLSITSRMSDNELRAQIINNNKMRLATESSQASEAYLAALNEAQFMFTNYEADNNVSYKPLTFNALTAYSPYNNQYALVNSANQVLISEIDARNYQNSANLAEFLKCYGLEENTTYFDNLPTDENGYATYTYYGDDGNAYTASTGFTPEALKLAYFGEEEGNIDQIGGTVPIQDCGYDNVLNGVDMYEYVTALSVYTQAKAEYLDQIDEIMSAKLDGIVKSTTNGAYSNIDALIKKLQDTTWDNDSIRNFYNTVLYPLVSTDMPNKYPEYGDARPSNVVSETYKLATDAGKEYLYELEDKLSIPSCHCSQYHNDLGVKFSLTSLNVNANFSYSYIDANGNEQKGETTYSLKDAKSKNVKKNASGQTVIVDNNLKDKDGNPVEYTLKGYTMSAPEAVGGLNKKFEIAWDANGKKKAGYPIMYDSKEPATSSEMKSGTALNPQANGRYEYTFENEKTNEKTTIGIECCTDEKYGPCGNNFDLAIDSTTGLAKVGDNGQTMPTYITFPDTPEQKASDAVNLLQNLKGSLPMIWNQTDEEFAKADSGTNNAFKAYIEAANELYEEIYGRSINYMETSGPPAIDQLDNITLLYNEQGNSGMPAFCDEMRPIFMNLVLDNVMDTYGEPKITWINTEDPNDNSEKRTQWYTNLYNRINASGYHVLKDGLAASPEWIKFAFESGIVTMEQVDSYNAWNQLIYTNCSDITEQTNDKAVTIAEAEYNAAMNKIENKDKRYDLELKNIDTEHNSLQTEYDSIKEAIDKNIERNFKYLS